ELTWAAASRAGNNTAAHRSIQSISLPCQPIVSSESQVSCRPSRLIKPNEGLSAGTPQYAAGLMMEPPVCVLSANGTIPAATAAAEPLEEPPGVWPRCQGLRVGPG